MRKYFFVLFVSFCSALLSLSCEDLFNTSKDITIKNACGAAVDAAVTNSASEPSSSMIKKISNGNSAEFDDVSGTAYLHVRSASYDDNEWYLAKLPASSNDTYTVQWTGSSYKIIYSVIVYH